MSVMFWPHKTTRRGVVKKRPNKRQERPKKWDSWLKWPLSGWGLDQLMLQDMDGTLTGLQGPWSSCSWVVKNFGQEVMVIEVWFWSFTKWFGPSNLEYVNLPGNVLPSQPDVSCRHGRSAIHGDCSSSHAPNRHRAAWSNQGKWGQNQALVVLWGMAKPPHTWSLNGLSWFTLRPCSLVFFKGYSGVFTGGTNWGDMTHCHKLDELWIMIWRFLSPFLRRLFKEGVKDIKALQKHPEYQTEEGLWQGSLCFSLFPALRWTPFCETSLNGVAVGAQAVNFPSSERLTKASSGKKDDDSETVMDS